jgi:hypothetical protein
MHSVFFLTLAMGSMFFITIHRVGNAGWQTAIRRVPEAMTTWLPVAGIFFVILLLMADHIYEWLILEPGVDALIDEKRPYLNWPFFSARTVVFFGVWILAAWAIRRLSLREDLEGGLQQFNRVLPISALFIIFFAISYSLFSIDWIKSLEPHWFSTIFGIYVFAGSMASTMAAMALLVHFLKRQGYMRYVNDAHLHDINKYAFGFCVFWAYIWISQYLLIWYSNIPEETIYFVKRYATEDHEYLGYAPYFWANLFLCFVIPFLGFMSRNAKRDPKIFVPIAFIILIGHWNDIFQMVMPGAMLDKGSIGLIEIGWLLFFAGLFLLVVFRSLSRANLVPVNHPYLEESLHHTTGPV